MGMDHESECCCTQPVPCKDNNEVTFNEVNCCTEFTTEFSSSADFEILKKLELNELILLFSIDISQDITHNHPSTLFYTPNKIEFSSSGDIPIRHSSLLI